MFGSSVPRGSSQRHFPFDPTKPNPFSSQSPAQTIPQSAYSQPANSSQIPNDPFPNAARNLFSDLQEDSNDASDPFNGTLDLSNQLSLHRPLDAVKFLLKHCRIDQLDPELFVRLKQRVFTVPHAVEQLIKEDAYFKCLLLQLYTALRTQTGLDMRVAISDFRSDAVSSQTCVEELMDLMVMYCMYRAGSLRESNVPSALISQTQEIVEISFRTSRSDLLELVQQCRDGIARYENSDLLTGASLDDSPGQLFLADPQIRPIFIHILSTCHSLYLTSNSALLVDISILMSRLMIGKVQFHESKQIQVGKSLERFELWLARRRPVVQDLQSACIMLDKLQDFPGDSALIEDALRYGLHPVFSETLRLVIRLNGVPRNRLNWKDFESLGADAQLQLDADPEAAIDAIALHNRAITATQIRPPAPLQPAPPAVFPIEQMQLQGSDPRKKAEDALLDLAKLPSPPASFPLKAEDAYAVVIACKDCPEKFSFSVSEQESYIKIMPLPNFPVRCSDCRYVKKMRNNDPLSVDSRFLKKDAALPVTVALPIAPTNAEEDIDEVIQWDEDFDIEL